MSDKSDFPVRSLIQIAFAKADLPFVRHAAKVGSERNLTGAAQRTNARFYNGA